MKVHSIINGGVSLLLEPENSVEEEILKTLTKQESIITEVRNQVTILNKNIKSSILICKEESSYKKTIDFIPLDERIKDQFTDDNYKEITKVL